MFYCNPCGQERGWPINTPSTSHGACELCGKGGVCNDVASKHLPLPAANQDGTPRAGDRESWLECVWDGLHAYREDLIPEGDESYDATWSDICTAMAWIREALGLPSEVEIEQQPTAIEIVARVFREAKDAPTSFEDEKWLDGFEDGRQIIGERVALELNRAGMSGFDERQFREDCDLNLEVLWDRPIEWSTGEEASFAPYDDQMPNHHVTSCREWLSDTGDSHVAVDDDGQILGCEDEGYPVIRNRKGDAS